MSNALISVADLRSRIDVAPNLEPRLSRLCDAVAAQWEAMTGRLWARREDYVHEVEVSDGDTAIWLPLFPVETMVLDDWTGGAWTAVSADSFRVSASGRLSLETGLRFAAGRFRATITGGYTRETLPADVLDALIVQVLFTQKRNSDSNLVQRTQGFQGGSTSFLDPGYHPVFQAAVANHERHV